MTNQPIFRFVRALGVPVVLALTACATGASKDNGGAELTPQMARDSAELQGYRIRNWSAPNDQTLIIESIDGTRYEAKLLGTCLGLQFATRLAFINRGSNRIDRFSGVVLPDGTRCAFRSFQEIVTPATSAREAGEAPAKP